MVGNVLGNRYEILEKIGDGGMAFVYKAKCRILNRTVALKVLRPEFVDDEEFVLKFKNEALASASLAHPNIVNIYDVGQEDRTHYIVMEYIDGLNLKDLIKKEGPLDPFYALNITKQIAMALSQAHKNGIIHRDIKPHNILISKDGLAKVADFGIAKATTSTTITAMGSVIGSVHYFSPEQARGGYVDKSSDLYSLGIVLYEMLTGKVPFKGDTPVNIALKHINEEIIFSQEFEGKISKEIKMLVCKLTQKNQINRYQNAEELIRDIEYIENDIEPDFEEDYEYYATQKLDTLNEEIKKQISKDYKEEGAKVDMRNKKKKSNKRILTILAVFVALILSLGLTFAAYMVKDLFITKQYEMPNLENSTIDEARKRLETIGVKVQIRRELYDDSVEKDHIITQIPKEGSKIKKGQVVKVDVSKGGEPVVVPNLVRENLEEADNILEKNNLKEGIIEYEFSSLPEGTVISQKPKAFTEVEEGTGIDLVVSKGEEVKLIKVPNLIGKTIEDARTDLVGFTIGSISYKEDKTKKEGVILEQSLRAGQHVEEGTKIDLTVNEYKEEPEEESPKVVKKQISIALPEDEEIVNVLVKEIGNNSSKTIYNKEINIKEKGNIVSVPIEGTGEKEYEIYVDDALYGTTSVDFE
ncbi:Stk1 family PASTA domain-containing Ser/Thr kinase [Tepidibacter formicigenes]|uniref:non-specific serine/threonine protein kinase n=1 Tax=Tepidibacter formicigenes DSM 15518 TaxID=1123349 RepID=A0A1M6KHF5_9FIRM|nr:Stk1 family PASTA domain-containing Ser/Thr kinase [Tepidibacter formicigenes]SHJ58376.1 serine/threonine protein kinase [Tepidibacter formicigenes DSM 15518]